MILRRLAAFGAAALLAGGCSKKAAVSHDTATTAVKEVAPLPDSIIGRDSAFGPIGTMDSDGTVRPIRR